MKSTNPEPKLTLTVKELAAQLQVSMPTAYELTERAGFPVIRLGKKKIVPVEALKAWLAQESGMGA